MLNVKVFGMILIAAVVLASADPAARPVSLEEDSRAVVGGNSAFAFDLYNEVKKAEGNLFFSPFSVSAALAMTYGGARGETEAQMARVLRFDLPQDRLHGAFASLNDRLQGGGACRLSVANVLWGQQGYGFLDEYLALTAEQYDAGFREVDFAKATEQARLTINAWIADKTEERIEELLHQGDIDPEVLLVLTNAIYFKSSWMGRFDRSLTRNLPFKVSSATEVSTPMMHRVGKFAYTMDGDLDIIELPYEGDRLSMVVLLPKAAAGLQNLEESLSSKNLERWLERLKVEPVRVMLPRFRIGARFDLSETLPAMGMTDAFSRRADFSGMTGRKELFISKVIHQARVEVNEEGSEAAGGTAVVMKKGPALPEFIADHPFLFLIRDKQTGSILFLGRVVNPQE